MNMVNMKMIVSPTCGHIPVQPRPPLCWLGEGSDGQPSLYFHCGHPGIVASHQLAPSIATHQGVWSRYDVTVQVQQSLQRTFVKFYREGPYSSC